MPSVYEKGEIKFLYPDGWQVGDEELLQWPRTVTLRHASGAFWSLHVYTWATPPQQLIDESLAALQDEYEEIESEPVAEQIGPVEAVGADVSFYCLDFIVQAKIRSFTIDRRTYLVLWQGEDRDLDSLDMVFRAMTVSLIQNAASAVEK